MTQQLTSSPRRKLLDEGAFQELLSAAFTLQQHNQLANNPSTSPTEVLTEIVRIQRFIREGKADLADTAKLISRQAQTFAGADGVAIGILTGSELIYLAAVGTASRDLGRRVRRDSCLSENCLRTGLTFSTSDTLADRRLASSADYADVRSFVAVPVGYDRNIVGVLEARFKTPNAFTEGDVHNCELIAALVKELIARAGKVRAEKKASPSEHPAAAFDVVKESAEVNKLMALMNSSQIIEPFPLQVNGEETLRPFTGSLPDVPSPAATSPSELQTESLIQIPEKTGVTRESKPEKAYDEGGISSSPVQSAENTSTEDWTCRGCGQRLSEEEVFCGNCGLKRAIKPGGPLQSKWASLWYMKQAFPQKAKDKVALKSEAIVAPLVEQLATAETETSEDNSFKIQEPAEDIGDHSVGSTALVGHSAALHEVDSETPSLHVEWLPDGGAAASKNWLVHQWKTNRANFYLAGAAILLMLVVSGVGTAPEVRPSPNSTAPQLTLMEKMLVGVGIAEAPQAAENRGNPDTPVWVDLHTALYYCPGSDQYGRTEGGKIATQRSAQLDQFEPAHRKACN